MSDGLGEDETKFFLEEKGLKEEKVSSTGKVPKTRYGRGR